jgi:acetyl esterase/lipase
MKNPAKVVTASLILINVSVTFAEKSNKGLAERIELRSFQSLTLTDQQFLTGDKNGLPVTITGELRLPQGTTGRVPVVIILHGAAWLVASNELWSRILNAMGSLLSQSTATRDETWTTLTRTRDRWASSHTRSMRTAPRSCSRTRIDPGRIALMGTSRGGRGALYASLRR